MTPERPKGGARSRGVGAITKPPVRLQNRFPRKAQNKASFMPLWIWELIHAACLSRVRAAANLM